MNEKKMTKMLGLATVLLAANWANADTFGTGANQFTIDFVTISGSTNPASGIPAGSGFTFTGVSADYRIGVYEISNAQWENFAAALGVPVTGAPASAYDEAPSWTGANQPNNGVSWYEAAQFVNWLNVSAGHHEAYKFTGTQGQSDYTLGVWNAAEADNGTNLYRHKDAFYFLPTEDEWVKAAYWNGTGLQGYANADPADLVAGLPDPTKWNYIPSAGNAPWDVGSGVEELNGTFDMMGNVWEWMESTWSDPNYDVASSRALRGGSYQGDDSLKSDFRFNYDPNVDAGNLGFRVASEVPEPTSMALLSLAALAILRRRRVA